MTKLLKNPDQKMSFFFTKHAIGAIFFAAMSSQLAWAIDPFTVRDIRVEGLQRVEPGTVFISLPFQVGDSYSDEKASSAIRALYSLGLFKDVRIDVQGNVVVVIVEERPSIADISFTGIKEFEKDALIKALKETGLAEGRAFDRALADRAEQEIKRQYLSKSLYGAEVITTVTPIERNRINLSFNVVEGEIAKIKNIQIIGAQAFSESTLKDQFDLDTGGWLSWYTKNDRYSRTKLNADLETLRSYYLSRGYLEFKIDSTQVSISPDKQSIGITINITEGQRYIVSGIKLDGDYLGKEDEFKPLIKVAPGQAYNAETVAQTTKAMSEYFGNFGYAFAQVQARPEIDRANARVGLILTAEPSRRAYVRKINIVGNARTRDEVIRREFRQMEAGWYDGEKIKNSRDRVDRLGYFKEVDVSSSEVPGSNDQVDLQVKVEEKSTGNILLGAGYSSSQKLSLQFKVQQENVFGSGQYLGININTSRFDRNVNINSTNPYFTADGISRSLDVYFRAQRPVDQTITDYRLETLGGSLRFGVPFSERHTVFFGLGFEQYKIVPGTNIPAAYLTYASRVGYTSTGIPMTIGWASDTRDSATIPSRGILQRVNSVWGLGGDSRYLKSDYQYQQYIPLSKKYTFAFNTELGWGKGLSDMPFPVFKNFYAGGLGSVRGYGQGTLGPRDITGSFLGGAKKAQLSTEIQTPFPGVGNDRSLRLYAFTDIGNVFSENQKYRFNDMRASVGAGLSWISPVGPLRFSYAKPLRVQPSDRIEKFQFQVGTAF